jgi:hypothetical protein
MDGMPKMQDAFFGVVRVTPNLPYFSEELILYDFVSQLITTLSYRFCACITC